MAFWVKTCWSLGSSKALSWKTNQTSVQSKQLKHMAFKNKMVTKEGSLLDPSRGVAALVVGVVVVTETVHS